MAGGDDDARVAAQVPDRKRQDRGWRDLVKEEGANAIGTKGHVRFSSAKFRELFRES